MPQLDSDNFNAYSDGNLATQSGGKWAKLSAYTDMLVSTFRVVGGAGVETASEIASWAGSGTDHYSQCVITTNGSMQFCGPTICNNGSNSFYVFDARNLDNRIFLVTAGPTYTQIAGATTVGLASGDTIYIERVAGVITCKINGATAVSVTDTTLVSGKPGLRAFSNGAFLDTWAAGDFGGAAAPVGPLMGGKLLHGGLLRGGRLR